MFSGLFDVQLSAAAYINIVSSGHPVCVSEYRVLAASAHSVILYGGGRWEPEGTSHSELHYEQPFHITVISLMLNVKIVLTGKYLVVNLNVILKLRTWVFLIYD